jgi:hypothetical protein
MSRQATWGRNVAAGAPPAPDINAETYPFEQVQHALDASAYLVLFSRPDRQPSGGPLKARNGTQPVGFQLCEVLHRFDVSLQPPGVGLAAGNCVGEAVGRFTQRWMMIPKDFVAMPGADPPPTPLDPSRPQRFVMLDAVCMFGDGHDGFRGFGTGVTCPSSAGELGAMAIGNIMEGFGKFRGLEGTYTYCGRLSAEEGFRGAVTCRVMDPQGAIRADAPLPPLRPEANQGDSGVTYLLLRGQKRDKSVRTTYRFGPDGRVSGFDVMQDLRTVCAGCAVDGGLVSSIRFGPVVGRMTSAVALNILAPGAPGTGVAPIPFGAHNEYTFCDAAGKPLGQLTVDGGEGRTFRLGLFGLPGQQALRFGSVEPVVAGTGLFQRSTGLMSDNSVAGVSPHALATLYLFRLDDPSCRFRSAGNGAAGVAEEGWGPQPPIRPCAAPPTERSPG